MPYFVYILYSVTLEMYYIGSSENPEVRLRKHLANHKDFSARAKDWGICHSEKLSGKTQALIREKQLKSWKAKKKISRLVEIQVFLLKIKRLFNLFLTGMKIHLPIT